MKEMKEMKEKMMSMMSEKSDCCSDAVETNSNTKSKKVEEMIAIGAAYAINCKPCMELHKKMALKEGLTQEEMVWAIQVAEGVKSGASNKTKVIAEELFGKKIEDEKCCPEGSECCP
jgi:AhpD family alkylhydroperoxidase